MKISELYFKYIKDKHLERRGVTAERLARELEAGDFITIYDHSHFDWTERALSGVYRRDFWKIIDSAKPEAT